LEELKELPFSVEVIALIIQSFYPHGHTFSFFNDPFNAPFPEFKSTHLCFYQCIWLPFQYILAYL